MPQLRLGESGSASCSVVSISDLVDYSSLGFSVHGLLQARILEWVAMPFSRGSFQPRHKSGSSIFQADSLPWCCQVNKYIKIKD